MQSIDAAWRYLVDEQKVPPKQASRKRQRASSHRHDCMSQLSPTLCAEIIVFGHSIGTGPSVDLANEPQKDALVLPTTNL